MILAANYCVCHHRHKWFLAERGRQKPSSLLHSVSFALGSVASFGFGKKDIGACLTLAFLDGSVLALACPLTVAICSLGFSLSEGF